jgi:hypothetical protein
MKENLKLLKTYIKNSELFIFGTVLALNWPNGIRIESVLGSHKKDITRVRIQTIEL